MPATLNLNPDLDQSGTSFQRVKVWQGPSLGWTEVFIKPSQRITTGGVTTLTGGSSVVLVDVAATVTLNLPDVTRWISQPAGQPSTSLERILVVKDFGGHAASFNITIDGFGTQTIDGSLTATISTNFGYLRLYPLNSGAGWFVG